MPYALDNNNGFFSCEMGLSQAAHVIAPWMDWTILDDGVTWVAAWNILRYSFSLNKQLLGMLFMNGALNYGEYDSLCQKVQALCPAENVQQQVPVRLHAAAPEA